MILKKDKLFNDNYAQDVGDLTIPSEDLNHGFMRKLRHCEVKEALHPMKTRKAIGSDAIPTEVWKYLGEVGVRWLTNLFNKIWQSNKGHVRGNSYKRKNLWWTDG